jgi:hypothetical protein
VDAGFFGFSGFFGLRLVVVVEGFWALGVVPQAAPTDAMAAAPPARNRRRESGPLAFC